MCPKLMLDLLSRLEYFPCRRVLPALTPEISTVEPVLSNHLLEKHTGYLNTVHKLFRQVLFSAGWTVKSNLH